nr:FUSC family protein [Roseibium sp. RKSG952]
MDTLPATKPAPVPALRLALQGGIAAAIAVFIAHVFGLHHAFWVPMTVIFVLSNSLGQTLRRSIERVLGTVIGVVVAFGAFAIWKEAPLVLGVISLVCFSLVFVATDRHYVAGSAVVAFSVVLGLHLLTGIGVADMLARAYDTAIGAIAGALIAFVVFPIKTDIRIRGCLVDILDEARRLMTEEASRNAVSVKEGRLLVLQVNQFAAQLAAFRDEQVILTASALRSREFLSYLEMLADYTALFCLARYNFLQDKSMQEWVPLIVELESLLVQSFDALETHETIPDLTQTAAKWRAMLPLDDDTEAASLIDLVNQMYYARKIVSTVQALSEDPVFRFILR